MTFRWLLALAVVGGVAFACGGDDSGDGDDEGGNDCPTDVDYAKVGKPFVEKYCSDCHGPNADEDDRAGAEDVVLGTEAQVRSHGMHVFERVVDQKTMPPKNEPQPTPDELADFAAWLECSGISEVEHEH